MLGGSLREHLGNYEIHARSKVTDIARRNARLKSKWAGQGKSFKNMYRYITLFALHLSHVSINTFLNKNCISIL